MAWLVHLSTVMCMHFVQCEYNVTATQQSCDDSKCGRQVVVLVDLCGQDEMLSKPVFVS